MIRQMTEQDIPEVIELGRKMYSESANWKCLSFSPTRIEDIARLTIQSGFAMVAEKGGRLIGMMAGCVVMPFFSEEIMSCDYVLYVLPEFRSGMAAIHLADGFSAWSRYKGAKLITVGVTAGIDNAAAIAFYEALGFRQSGSQLIMEV